jgi:flagellar protein FlaI
MERTITDLKLKVIEALAGKLNLAQDYAERKRLVCEAFLELAKIPEEKGLIKKLGFSVDMVSAETFAQDFLSFEVIAGFLKDPDVEDIVIDGLKPVFLHSSKQGFIETDKKFDNSRELEMFVKKLIVFSGRPNINNIGEIVNLEFPDNVGRVNIVYSPFGPQLTITRAKLQPLSIIDLIDRQALSYELAAQLWLYVEGISLKPANIIIAGGPGAGKTTLLNAVMAFIPPNDRLVVIEDTLELNTSAQAECSRLESNDNVSLADLVKNSLRMRPDRIIIGEVRGAEAKDLMTAMNVGRYCMGTIHASTAREAIIRLQNEPMNAPSVLINLVDVFVIMKKFESNGIIKRAISELVETAGLEQKEVLICPVWRYDSETAKFLELGPGPYRDHLAKARGIYPTEVIKEVAQRAEILRKLKKLGKTSQQEVARFCGLYCADKQKAMAELKA